MGNKWFSVPWSKWPLDFMLTFHTQNASLYCHFKEVSISTEIRGNRKQMVVPADEPDEKFLGAVGFVDQHFPVGCWETHPPQQCNGCSCSQSSMEGWAASSSNREPLMTAAKHCQRGLPCTDTPPQACFPGSSQFLANSSCSSFSAELSPLITRVCSTSHAPQPGAGTSRATAAARGQEAEAQNCCSVPREAAESIIPFDIWYKVQTILVCSSSVLF